MAILRPARFLFLKIEMPKSLPLYGFTLLRNGLKYDYCFQEALTSLSGVCSKIFLALGESEDETAKVISSMPFIEVIPTVWDESLRAGGLILSQQTNIALERAKACDQADAWGIYLQCDEVFHEEDYELIKEDITKAQQQGCDAISFRYWHFWQTHHHVAINKKWYPQEIRAIKLNSSIESWGDAQSFRNWTKCYQSNARIFHYGHVREPSKYLDKKRDILTLYHSDEKLAKYKKREKKFDNQTKTLLFFGNHPKVMKERIIRLGDIWQLPAKEEVYIVGDKADFSSKIEQKINAQKVHWSHSLKQVPKKHRRQAIIFRPNFWQKIFYPSKVPSKMLSPLALEWMSDDLLTLKLSEKNIGLKEIL